MGLRSPLLLVIPLSLLAIVSTVRLSFRSLRVFRNDLARRNAQDLTPIDGRGLPNEIAPVSTALNQLLGRLKAAGHAAQIETALKRLTRMSEKLRQLARAEGGRMQTGQSIDLRPLWFEMNPDTPPVTPADHPG